MPNHGQVNEFMPSNVGGGRIWLCVGDRAICAPSVECHVQRLSGISHILYLCVFDFDADPNQRDILPILSLSRKSQHFGKPEQTLLRTLLRMGCHHPIVSRFRNDCEASVPTAECAGCTARRRSAL